jgi:hypothetical protein
MLQVIRILHQCVYLRAAVVVSRAEGGCRGYEIVHTYINFTVRWWLRLLFCAIFLNGTETATVEGTHINIPR